MNRFRFLVPLVGLAWLATACDPELDTTVPERPATTTEAPSVVGNDRDAPEATQTAPATASDDDDDATAGATGAATGTDLDAVTMIDAEAPATQADISTDAEMDGVAAGTATNDIADTATEEATEVVLPEPDPCPALNPEKALLFPGTEWRELSRVADMRWTAAGSPHRVTASLELSLGRTLTIEPCAVVVFSENKTMVIGTSSGPGRLVAEGLADAPIVIRGATPRTGTWGGLLFTDTLPDTRLSHVRLQHAGQGTGEFDAAVVLYQHEALVQIDHVVIEGSLTNGIALEQGGQLLPGSEGNVITGAVGYPIVTSELSVGGVADGQYTGNGTDMVRVLSNAEIIGDDFTWHRLSVPWQVYGTRIGIVGRLTFEPGVHVIFDTERQEFPTIEVYEGGSIVADGGSEEGRIRFTGEAGAPTPSWGGFWFDVDVHESRFNFVEFTNAGTMWAPNATHACATDGGEGVYAALSFSKLPIHLAPVVRVTNTRFVNIGPRAFAINREVCDSPSDAADMATNEFIGSMLCGATDVVPCSFDGEICDSFPFVCEYLPTE